MCLVLINISIIVLFIVGMNLGNSICKLIFSLYDISKPPPPESTTNDGVDVDIEKSNKTGRAIGLLERLIIGIGILLQSWPIVAGVVALKSISRYKELDKQPNAEYFLVGSMVSILWSFIVTFVFIGMNTLMKEKNVYVSNVIGFIINYAKSGS